MAYLTLTHQVELRQRLSPKQAETLRRAMVSGRVKKGMGVRDVNGNPVGEVSKILLDGLELVVTVTLGPGLEVRRNPWRLVWLG